jgi:D-alanyl-D-alanine carboxypeptidase
MKEGGALMSIKPVYLFRRFVFVLALAVCLMLSTGAGKLTAQAGSTLSTQEPPFAGELRPLLLAHMQELSVPGAIVYVNDPGQGAWTTALGTRTLATGAPMQVKSSMRIGSITKTMTATVILQLVDRHKLGLDDPVSTYLSHVPNGMHITIRELLNMTSGLFSYTEDLGFEKQAWGTDPFKVWTPQALLAIAYKHPPDFAPGEGWHYSNTNTILLGLLIEQRTHLSVAQAFQRYLFEPLEMDHTGLPFLTSAAIPYPHPHGYSLLLPGRTQPVDATDWNPSWAWAAGSAISTLHDLKIWAKALATGQLLSAAMQHERLQLVPQSPHLFRYGLGIVDIVGFLGHTGQLPGFQSFMGYRPRDGAAIIVLVNLDAAPNGTTPADVLAVGVIYKALFA